jgi:alanine racemase
VYTISEIAAAINAQVKGNHERIGNIQLLTDSRNLTNADESIFIALKTKFNDGHIYIPELIKKGVNYYIVDQAFNITNHINSCFLIVEDTLDALQKLATYHRNKFSIPIIGITGSNGKTIVKEWLTQVLKDYYSICANPKSYNSQIGVPLSIWQLNKNHTLGIFEAGISKVEEMDKLSNIIQANFGILTHLGTAHNEGFDSPEQKLIEKLKLFKNCTKVYTVYNSSVVDALQEKAYTFGYNEPRAHLNIIEKKSAQSYTNIICEYDTKTYKFKIPFTDEASIENACLCCLVCLSLGKFNANAFESLKPISMRMELKKGIHSCILVNDSYSNDINALSNALSFLKQQSIHSKATVILSDIEGSGLPPQILYQQVKTLLIDKKIKRIIGIGPDYWATKEIFNKDFETDFYIDTDAFLDNFYTLKFHEENILIKGARKFEFERIVKKLEQENHGTVLEINLSAALKNLYAIKNKMPKDIKVMAMVKAFAYGSGSYEIAKLLQNKVDYLAVAYIDEGIALRKSGILTPIMVLNSESEAVEQLSHYGLEPVVFSNDLLNEFLNESYNSTLKIHIEIDTGMHRLGYQEQEIDALLQIISSNKHIKIASIFSHLSGSDEAQFDDFTRLQISVFNKIANKIEKSIGYNTIKHISNTAAALRFEQTDLDMVRLGIGLYGIDPSGLFANLLEPVFTLKTHISQIKIIKANESIGYSRKSISNSERRIAVLALGYADGLNRALSNGIGGFFINNQFAPIAGNICMDMCMVDVSKIDCKAGDEAILFGKEYPIDKVADQLNTIPYEILTSISQRVKRIYVSE